MLRKKETYTVITPIPSFIPRQLALDILHSHSEVITLNPLVLSHRAIPAPRNAVADEYYSTWYEITERVQLIPGVGRLGSGQITFNGCFHDMPWGLQTHIYAPMNIDLRNKYRIGGNQPGVEPPEQRELGMEGLGVPTSGLYLRQEAEIKCNIAMVGFVKSETKKACKDMVDRIIKKAELLDSGALQAMFENGKLKTVNPNDRSNLPRVASPLSATGSFVSPQLGHASAFTGPDPMSSSPPPPPPPQQHSPRQYMHAHQSPPKEQAVVLELPGDPVYTNAGSIPSPQPSPTFQNSQRWSLASFDRRWPQGPVQPLADEQHRMSVSSSTGSIGGQPQRQGYAAELASHHETREEHR